MTGSTQDKIWHLERINLFQELPSDDMQKLNGLSEMRDVPDGTALFVPGDVSEKVFFLKKGRIKLSRIAPNGRTLTLGYIEPGEIFGELSVSEEEQRSTLAEAVETSLVCTMDRDAFEKFLATRPALGLKVAKFMGFRLRRIEARIQDLLFLDVKGRIRKVLADLAEDHGVVTPAGIRIPFKLTHEDIANLVATTRATATVALGELREEGALAFEGRQIFLPTAKPNLAEFRSPPVGS